MKLNGSVALAAYHLLVYADFFFTTGMKRNAGYQRNALSDRHHFGMHPLVRNSPANTVLDEVVDQSLIWSSRC
jgi:hypothetical protein